MTKEELKEELYSKTYPEQVRISVDQLVSDVPKFLRVSFIEVDKWSKELDKCPAWVRLLKFKEAVSSTGN